MKPGLPVLLHEVKKFIAAINQKCSHLVQRCVKIF